MMLAGPVTDLLADLDQRDIELVADGDKLRFRPRSAVDDALMQRIRRHKPELLLIADGGELVSEVYQLDLLRRRLATAIRTARRDGDHDRARELREHFNERAAIREHDGGMTRPDAEAAAVGDVLDGDDKGLHRAR